MKRPSNFFITLCSVLAIVGLLWGIFARYGIFETLGLALACSCVGGFITFIKEVILKK